jgi:hypothetical protein
MGHDMIPDACDRRGRISRRGEIWAELRLMSSTLVDE